MRTNVNSIDDIILLILGLPTFFMMIVTSRGFTVIKIVLLVLFTLICLWQAILRRAKIKYNYFIYIFSFVTYFLLSLIYGIIQGYKFELQDDYVLIQYYIATPIIVFIIAFELSRTYKRVQFSLNAIQYITLFIVVMDVWKLLAYRHILPDIDFLNLFYISSNNTATELAMRISNEYALMYLIPFYTVLLFLVRNKKDRILNSIILGFGIIYCVLSGRKSLELVVFATLGFMVFYSAIKRKKLKPLLTIIIISIVLYFVLEKIGNALAVGNVIEKAINTIQQGLSSNSFGVSKRSDNMTALFDLWLKSPFWGNGLNSYSQSSLANSTNYWSYEVVYNALLAQTGLIGVGIFAVGIIYISKELLNRYQKENNPIFFACIIGFLSFVFSGATNPMIYIAWPWILTIVIVNIPKDHSQNKENNELESKNLNIGI
ncbi:MAG: hypothetical protein IJI63_03100 [Clostridiales bacterium]|nr:hypothetical protein [Clostridiales bacterium]